MKDFMRNWDLHTAKQAGIIDRLEALRNDLENIENVTRVEFSLFGFYAEPVRVCHVTIVAKYDLGYLDDRQSVIDAMTAIAAKYDLHDSEDVISDMGASIHMVRTCGESWTKKGVAK